MAQVEIDDHQINRIGGKDPGEMGTVTDAGHPKSMLGQIVDQQAAHACVIVNNENVLQFLLLAGQARVFKRGATA